ncbi:MAG: CAP domain-containing protein [Meiothermus sp.]|nr:CAP domain-containing protein [Meiothermus sp.]
MPGKQPTVWLTALLAGWALSAGPEGDLTFMLNDLRARGMACAGRSSTETVGLLTYNPRLEQAALRHARDMAERNFIAHTFAGLGPRDRVRQAGYDFLRLSEIIYKGGSTADPLRPLEWWLNSPAHCQAIMSPHYSEVGVAFWPQGNAWVVVLAQPR